MNRRRPTQPILTHRLPQEGDGAHMDLNEKLRVRFRRIPEFPIHGPSNMIQRSSRACLHSIATEDGQ